ncbi:lipase family alpha/beta hydrolase [Kroppenstedtia guangzhouensis]|nr:hypothetical protein [Kroppenstedtia guangzhouensis]
MKRRMWKGVVTLLAFLLVLPAGWVQGAASTEKAPKPKPAGVVPPPSKVQGEFKVTGGKGGGSDGGEPGTWYVGATPPNMDKSKPPIVFVQGLHGHASNWWEDTVYHGHNDMYDYAYNHGYRTAFVELYDSAGGDAADMWDNGALLARQLSEIRQYFGEKVNIVAHSKGGVDTQAALIHSGAYPHVGRVITLGSPHEGSHLANLAFSWWAGWLAELLGSRDAGTEVLQTGYMEYFRSVTDSHANVGKNNYYTSAGTSWGPFPSALWTGGAYLAPHGSNDGMVNVWSASLPYGQHLFTESFDHDNIRMGSTAFPRIEPSLRSAAVTTAERDALKEVAVSSADADSEGSEQVVRGDSLPAGTPVEEKVAVESGAKEAIFNLMTGDPSVSVRLISPSGKVYNHQSAQFYRTGGDEEIFRGAAIQGYRISDPEAGHWKVRLISEKDDAYLLTTTLMDSAEMKVDVQVPGKSGRDVPVRVNLPRGWKAKPENVKVRLVPPKAHSIHKMKADAFHGKLDSTGKERSSFSGHLPKQMKPGVYNLTVDVQGVNDKGEDFQRTVIRSFYLK